MDQQFKPEIKTPQQLKEFLQVNWERIQNIRKSQYELEKEYLPDAQRDQEDLDEILNLDNIPYEILGDYLEKVFFLLSLPKEVSPELKQYQNYKQFIEWAKNLGERTKKAKEEGKDRPEFTQEDLQWFEVLRWFWRIFVLGEYSPELSIKSIILESRKKANETIESILKETKELLEETSPEIREKTFAILYEEAAAERFPVIKELQPHYQRIEERIKSAENFYLQHFPEISDFLNLLLNGGYRDLRKDWVEDAKLTLKNLKLPLNNENIQKYVKIEKQRFIDELSQVFLALLLSKSQEQLEQIKVGSIVTKFRREFKSGVHYNESSRILKDENKKKELRLASVNVPETTTGRLAKMILNFSENLISKENALYVLEQAFNKALDYLEKNPNLKLMIQGEFEYSLKTEGNPEQEGYTISFPFGMLISLNGRSYFLPKGIVTLKLTKSNRGNLVWELTDVFDPAHVLRIKPGPQSRFTLDLKQAPLEIREAASIFMAKRGEYFIEGVKYREEI